MIMFTHSFSTHFYSNNDNGHMFASKALQKLVGKYSAESAKAAKKAKKVKVHDDIKTHPEDEKE